MGQKLPLKTKKVEILDIGVNPISLKNAVSLVEKWVNTNKQYQIVTPNPEQIVLAQKNVGFKNVLNKSDLAIPDGIGIVIAMRLINIKNKILKIKNTNKKLKILATSYQLPATRVCGTDLMMELCSLAERRKWRVFLLGGKGGVARQTVKKLTTNYKLLAASYHGAKNIKNETANERREAIKKINQFRPHLLFVAYGAPWQELWIARNLPKLKVKVAMGVGGAFDYTSGRVSRAPAWIRKAGFEWLYRLIKEPWRIKRQLRLAKFTFLVYKEFLEKRRLVLPN